MWSGTTLVPRLGTDEVRKVVCQRERERQLMWANSGSAGRSYSVVAAATFVWHLLCARHCGKCSVI